MTLTEVTSVLAPVQDVHEVTVKTAVLLTISPLKPGALAVMVLFPVQAPVAVKPVAEANPSVAAVQGAGEPLVQITATCVLSDFQVTWLVISLVTWWPAWP
jgi:hypothetical protein